MNKDAITHLKSADNKLAAVIDRIGDLEIHHREDPFCFLVGEIVGQMISNSVRKVIFERLTLLCKGEVTPEKIHSLTVDQIRTTGMSFAKASYIHNLALLTMQGTVDFDKLSTMDDLQVIKYLRNIKGVGDWTAKMFLIFYLGREDVVPYEDGAFLQAYKWLYNARSLKPKSIIRRCKCWSPYSSYGARFLYAALNRGLTKEDVGTIIL